MFIFIFAILDIIAGVLLLSSSTSLLGSDFTFWVAIIVLVKGLIIFVNEKFGAKGNKYPLMAILDFISAIALLSMSGGFVLPFYFALGLLMAGKGVWQFIESIVH